MAEIDKTPELAAAEMAELMTLINIPSANPIEDLLESMTGGGGFIRRFTPGGDQRAVPRELATRIKERLDGLLQQAHITPSFKDHLQNLIQGQLESGMLRVVGTDFILEQCGIDLPNQKYGVFSPDEAKGVEREAIRLNHPPRSMFTSVIMEHNQKMDKWIGEYDQTHHENPLK